MNQPNISPRAHIRDIIDTCFDTEELHDLCQDIDVNYDNLSGDSKRRKAGALVDFLQRTNQLDLLTQRILTLRPHLTTDDLCIEALRQDDLTADSAPEPAKPADTIGPNPYNGLAAFQESDTDRFFGRERVIEELWKICRALRERPLDKNVPLRLLAILGPSGSGKSSVARAGLLPELSARPLPGTSGVQVAIMTPGAHPIESLATLLARFDDTPRTPTAKMLELKGILTQDTHERYEGLRQIAGTLPDIDAKPLTLLIDQFEELYANEVNPDERRQFLENLLCAAADPAGHVTVILTLRSDFLAQTQQHPAFNQAIAHHAVVIPVMSDEDLRAAIAKPAAQAGHALSEATVDLLIQQTHDREGALPLLQFALTRIWDGLRDGTSPTDTLQQIGGVGGALAGEAQRRFEQLSAGDQAIARRAFLSLVQLGEGTRDTRRRVNVTDIVAQGDEAAHVQAVVRYFADPLVRLVTLSAANGTETAEVTHESLIEHWTTLREWLDANRDDLRFHRHLDTDANYWDTQGKPDGLLWRPPNLDLLHQFHDRASQDMTPLQVEFFTASTRKEQHSKRVRRMAVTALTLLTIIAIGAASFAWLMYGRANQQTIIANQQTAEALKQKAIAEQQTAEALQQKAIAEQQTAEALRLYHVSIVQSVINYADQYFYKGEREQAALLARQAFFLNNEYRASIENQITDSLQATLVLPEADIEKLLEQVCQQATRNLTPEEWRKVVTQENMTYQPCLNLPDAEADTRVSRLRSEPIRTENIQDLSLYVSQVESFFGNKVGTFIENSFELHVDGTVVFDHATGLMWQQSGSEESMTYKDALNSVETLNREQFAGFSDWRLPTVEELASLVEPEEKNGELYIDPIFDTTQSWCWSADMWQIKDESGSSSAAWGVSFYGGDVDLSYLGSSNYVRVVRP